MADPTVPEVQTDLARENERLRLENRVLREPKDVRFAFVCEHRHDWSIERWCLVLQVSIGVEGKVGMLAPTHRLEGTGAYPGAFCPE